LNLAVTIRAMVKGKSYSNSVRTAAGLTLVELMVVLAIAAILAAIAMPSLRKFLTANQLTTMTDTLASTLNEARSEAGKLGTNVTLNVNSGGKNWGSQGWTMSSSVGTLRNVAPAPSGFQIFSNQPFKGGVTFDSTGQVVSSNGQPGEIVICQGGGPSNGGAAQMIMVAVSGRVRIAQNDSSGNPIDVNGNSVTACQPDG
jgi:type IV fimbrial biogenesis protein FimT